MIIVSDSHDVVEQLNALGVSATTQINGNLQGQAVAVYALTETARRELIDHVSADTNRKPLPLPVGLSLEEVPARLEVFKLVATPQTGHKPPSFSLFKKANSLTTHQNGPLFDNALDAQATEFAAFTDTAREFADVAMIAVIGALSIGRYAAKVRPGWIERPIINAALVGDSGVGKSPIIKAVTEYLFAKQIEAFESDDIDLSVDGPASRYVTVDTTIEALATICANNRGRGVLKISDEKADHFASMTRYARNQLGDRPQWLQCWNGGPSVIDRKTNQKPLPIKCFGVGTLGGIQPSRLSLIYNDDAADGLEAREWVIYPDAVPISLSGSPTADASTWESVVDTLLAWRAADKPETFVPFADDARTCFEQWRFDLLNGKRQTGQPICPWTAKNPAHVTRAALIFAIADGALKNREPTEIKLAHVQQAIAYMRLLNSHRRRARLEAGGDSIEAIAIDLARFIVETGATELDTFELRHGRAVAGLRDENTLRRALGELAAARWLITPIGKRNDQPLPPSVGINPEVHRYAREL